MKNNCSNVFDVALDKLRVGNEMYLAAKNGVGDISLERRKESFAEGQKPYAVIVSCSDSRVIPESIFSTGIGELFVIRVVGNVVDSTVLASVDYAVSNLNTKLVVVLGHTGCGAIKTAISGEDCGRLQETIDKVKIAIGDETDDYIASRLNVQCGVKELATAIANGNQTVKVVGSIYFGDTGKVEFID